jgi:cholesterol transport system auxiliary component
MRRLLLTLSLSLIVMTGCMRLSLQKPPVEKHYFAITAGKIERPDSSLGSTDAILSVRPLRMDEIFSDASLVYRIGEVKWDSDYYNQFFITPQPMLTGIVRETISDSGLFAEVMSKGSILTPTHFLEGAVTALYGDYRDKSNPAAVVQMEFLLLDDQRGTPSIILKKRYAANVKIKEAAPELLVEAFGEGITEILSQLQRDIDTAMKGDQ